MNERLSPGEKFARDMREAAVRAGRLFKVDNSFLFAVQIPDDSVGISGSRCSNCDSGVPYCDQVCKSCNTPFIGPSGFPQSHAWKRLSLERKKGRVEEVYTHRNHGRLRWGNVLDVPLDPTELSTLEGLPLNGQDCEAFRSVHGVSPQEVRRILFEL